MIRFFARFCYGNEGEGKVYILLTVDVLNVESELSWIHACITWMHGRIQYNFYM